MRLSESEIESEKKRWFKILQYVEPGYGLVSKGKKNVLYNQNLVREARRLQGPLLATSQDQMVAHADYPNFPGSKLRQEARNPDEMMVDLLKRELYQTQNELTKLKRGGSAIKDVADNQDKTELNKSRPRNDVFEPVIREGNVGQKRKLLPAYDNGRNTKMRSVFDRGIDKRFIHH